MGEAIRKMRRRAVHQRLDAENIELRARLSGLTTVLGKMHGVMLRFSLGAANWACNTHVRSGWNWLQRKPKDVVPEYVWIGAGNPEKAAHEVMVECFGKDYRDRARAAFAAAKKEQKDEEDRAQALLGSTPAPNPISRGE